MPVGQHLFTFLFQGCHDRFGTVQGRLDFVQQVIIVADGLVEQQDGRGPSATPGGGQRQFNGFAGGDQERKQGFVRVQNGGAADGDRGGRGRGGGGGGGGGRDEDAVGVGGVGQKGQHVWGRGEKIVLIFCQRP